MMGIPFAYVLYVVYICYKKSLLPKGGKRRYLALYFLRLIVAFVLMWLPAIVLIYGSNLKVWIVSVVGGSLSHLQGLVRFYSYLNIFIRVFLLYFLTW